MRNAGDDEILTRVLLWREFYFMQIDSKSSQKSASVKYGKIVLWHHFEINLFTKEVLQLSPTMNSLIFQESPAFCESFAWERFETRNRSWEKRRVFFLLRQQEAYFIHAWIGTRKQGLQWVGMALKDLWRLDYSCYSRNLFPQTFSRWMLQTNERSARKRSRDCIKRLFFCKLKSIRVTFVRITGDTVEKNH